MDKDRVKGTIDDAAGRAKRQVGEWTGNNDMAAEGAAQQVKGKGEKAWGNVKDAARDAGNKMKEAANDSNRRENTDIHRNPPSGNFERQDQHKNH